MTGLKNPSNDNFGHLSGAVYVFRKDQANWVEHQKLTPDDVSPEIQFGSDMEFAKNQLVVSANGLGSKTAEGAAYLYRLKGTEWKCAQRLAPPHRTRFQQFGFSLSFDGESILIGTSGENRHAGAAYLYQVAPTSDKSN